ncbi:unnamed protein product [Closterium sp. NIES-53]
MAEEGERYRAQSSAEPAELSASRLADLSAAAAAATEGVTEDGDFPVEGAPAASPPFAAAATGGVPVERGEGSDEAIGGGIWTREFSEEGPDGTFHFQIVKLNQQVYLWVGLNTASHGNVYTAIPTRFVCAHLLIRLFRRLHNGSHLLIRQFRRLKCARTPSSAL